MKLGHRIIITVAAESFEIRPSLRHAIALERREGSFSQLVRDINEGSLTAALDIIAPHTTMKYLPNRVFDELATLKPALLEYVLSAAGIDPADKPAEGKSTGKSVPFSEHLQSLYRLGTGWMGWTPETTLDATPLEILEAYKGRTEMLKAVFGSGDDKPAKDDRPLDQKFRSIFASHQIVREEA